MFIGATCFIFIFGQIKSNNSFPKPIGPKEEKEYLQACADGNMEARNRLVEHNLRLVAFISKKYQNAANDNEDLISVGTVGLIKAIQTFDREKGNRLATYASRCIENAMLRGAPKGARNHDNFSFAPDGYPLFLFRMVHE